jgi:hypothetical protein
MSAMPSPIESDYGPGSVPIRGAVESSDLEDDPFAGSGRHQSEQPRTRRSASAFRLLITFCLGIAATVAWYSFGDQAREKIAGMSPQLAWVAPQQTSAADAAADPATPTAPTLDQQLSAASVDIEVVRQKVDRVATSQDKIIRSIDQLTAGQELLTKEIAKLQAVEQYILYKNTEPPARPTPPAPSPVRRPAAPLPLTPAPAAPQTSQATPPPAPR